MDTILDHATAILRLIPEGEKFSATASPQVDNPDVYDIRFAIRADKDAPRYEVRVTADFSGVAREQLIDLALYDVKVRLQAELRSMGEGMFRIPQPMRVDVLGDLINKGRTPVDPVVRARRALAALGITEAQITEMLSQRTVAE